MATEPLDEELQEVEELIPPIEETKPPQDLGRQPYTVRPGKTVTVRGEDYGEGETVMLRSDQAERLKDCVA